MQCILLNCSSKANQYISSKEITTRNFFVAENIEKSKLYVPKKIISLRHVFLRRLRSSPMKSLFINVNFYMGLE